jgi:hypothetical protein
MEIIPLGSTCCIAYQLKAHNLRNYSYPFDWVRVNNLNNVTNLLDNKFNTFLDINQYKLEMISNEFEVNGNMISYIYKNEYCKFYHDFDTYICDKTFEPFVIKYKRRINRLIETIKNKDRILFIREETRNLNIDKIRKFSKAINNINPNLNWKMKIIVYQKKYTELEFENIEIILSTLKVTDWRRSELNWKEIFKY